MSVHACTTSAHWLAVKRNLRISKGTFDHGLHFKSSPFDHSAFSDADWAGCPDDRRSTSGYCICLGNNLSSWSAKKQPTISKSSIEVEYCSLAHTATELSSIHNLLKDITIFLHDPPII